MEVGLHLLFVHFRAVEMLYSLFPLEPKNVHTYSLVGPPLLGIMHTEDFHTPHQKPVVNDENICTSLL